MYKCDICNKEFNNHRQLNGHKSSHNNPRFSVSRKGYKIKSKKSYKGSCKECGTETNNPKYCSIICQGKHNRKIRKERIENGEILKFSSMVKYFRENRDNVCSECNLKTIWNNKPIVLHIDHINGNWYDNNLSNLRFLCPNCHSQTPTWGNNKRTKIGN
jgi:hypothetical protein